MTKCQRFLWDKMAAPDIFVVCDSYFITKFFHSERAKSCSNIIWKIIDFKTLVITHTDMFARALCSRARERERENILILSGISKIHSHTYLVGIGLLKWEEKHSSKHEWLTSLEMTFMQDRLRLRSSSLQLNQSLRCSHCGYLKLPRYFLQTIFGCYRKCTGLS